MSAEKHLLRHKADQEAQNFINTRFRGWAQGEYKQPLVLLETGFA